MPLVWREKIAVFLKWGDTGIFVVEKFQYLYFIIELYMIGIISAKYESWLICYQVLISEKSN